MALKIFRVIHLIIGFFYLLFSIYVTAFSIGITSQPILEIIKEVGYPVVLSIVFALVSFVLFQYQTRVDANAGINSLSTKSMIYLVINIVLVIYTLKKFGF